MQLYWALCSECFKDLNTGKKRKYGSRKVAMYSIDVIYSSDHLFPADLLEIAFENNFMLNNK